MSRRLREKRNTAANLLRQIAASTDHLSALGCGYGCHVWTFDSEAQTKTCSTCGAVYAMPAAETAEMYRRMP